MLRIKYYLIVIIALLLALPANAQGDKTRTFSQRLFDAKVAQIEKSLNLSDEEVARFIPIYREYTEEMIRVWNELVAAFSGDTDSPAFRSLRRERSLQIRQEYTEKFAEILSDAEIKLFFKVENEIQRRLRARKEQALKH